MIPACFALAFVFHARERDAFLASCGFIATMLVSTAAGLYPNLLVSTLDPRYNLTVGNVSTTDLGMRYGLMIWVPAILLAIGYFAYLFWSFRGKVDLGAGGYYH